MNQKIKQKVLSKRLIVAFLSLFLTSCATQKQTQVDDSLSTGVATDTEIQATKNNAQYYVDQARSAPSAQAPALLVKACQQYLQENNPEKALWLANLNQPLLTEPELIYQTQIIKAEALLKLNALEKAKIQLNNAAQTADENNFKHTLSYYQNADSIETALDQPVNAVYAKMQAFALNLQADELEANTIWSALSELPEWQLEQLIESKPPHIKGWARLSQYARKFGANEAQFKRFLAQWRKQFPTHPAQMVVASLSDTPELILPGASTVAVLLPLSGNQSSAGKAAQQGMLAAYEQDKSKQLIFVDTNTVDWQTLSEQLIEQNVDYIVGPLLRANVRKLLALEAITIPTLLLNLPSGQPLNEHQTAISMRPEDEAVQAAASLVKKNYKHPVMLVHEDKVSRRIATAFSNEWQRLTGEPIEIVPFRQGKKMQENLKASLDVDKSQARIKAIDSRIKQTIKYEARNRRDVDMMYIIGSAAQTRLLKPYIDVNISPFANVIPIYASSRSHSAKMDEADVQDLSGLTFTEMPWLMPSKQQNTKLFKQVKTLFPNRSDSLQGIFAMGYDSLNLVDKIPYMQERSYIRHYGQTGILKLNSNNVLTRSLIWGRYQRNRVQEIAVAK